MLTAQNVVVVGSSVSGMDAALDLIGHAKTPVVSSSRGSKHPYFGDSALGHPKILRRPEISHISPRGVPKAPPNANGSSQCTSLSVSLLSLARHVNGHPPS